MGRHKEFDPDEILERAMDAFWLKGYRGTSVQDLVDATGLHRASLYATFGDKEALYLAALERYFELEIDGIFAPLNRPGPRLDAIREIFMRVVTAEELRQDRRGCMIYNAAAEFCPDDGPIGDQVRAGLSRAEEYLFNALKEAQTNGEIAQDIEPRSVARYLTNNLNGLRIWAKAFADPKVLYDIVNATLATLDTPDRPQVDRPSDDRSAIHT